MFNVEQIDHVAFVARDIERLVAWYQELFGMERRYADVWTGQGDPVALCADDACVALFRARDSTETHKEPQHPNRHFALRLDQANFRQAQVDLHARGISFSLWDHKVSQSVYFTDPEGNYIELTTYEVSG